MAAKAQWINPIDFEVEKARAMSPGSQAEFASPTISDVAAACGFSVATVSRVLNGVNPVHAATAASVKAMARNLGYEPDAAAQSLARRSALIRRQRALNRG